MAASAGDFHPRADVFAMGAAVLRIVRGNASAGGVSAFLLAGHTSTSPLAMSAPQADMQDFDAKNHGREGLIDLNLIAIKSMVRISKILNVIPIVDK